jgi:protein phosphatase
MQLKISVATNIGKFRINNEDNYYANGKILTDGVSDDFSITYTEEVTDHALFAVCDGMGGESCGEVASATAVNVLDAFREKIFSAADNKEQSEAVYEYARTASLAINEEILKAGGRKGGTTLTLACVKNGIVSMYYLGDSRIYLYRDDVLTRLTRDHTVAYEMIDSNVLTEEEAEKSPDRHRLTMYLGYDDDPSDIKAGFAGSYTLAEGERFLMCTDGLNEMCSSEEIRSILSTAGDDAAKALVDKALENGGMDNVTCIVLEVC